MSASTIVSTTPSCCSSVNSSPKFKPLEGKDSCDHCLVEEPIVRKRRRLLYAGGVNVRGVCFGVGVGGLGGGGNNQSGEWGEN